MRLIKKNCNVCFKIFIFQKAKEETKKITTQTEDEIELEKFCVSLEERKQKIRENELKLKIKEFEYKKKLNDLGLGLKENDN